VTLEKRRKRTIDAILLSLLLLDVTLSVWAFFFPDAWFSVFHGVPRVDPQGLLPRMAANWAAFAVFQTVALVRWRRRPYWLAVAAGLRLSDIFTDWTYLVACHDVTWFGRIALLAASPMNVLAGWQLLRLYSASEAGAVPPPAPEGHAGNENCASPRSRPTDRVSKSDPRDP
jgi:hypothetical protein